MRLVAVAALALTVVALAAAAGAGAFGGRSYPPRGAPPAPSPAELQTLGRIALTDASSAGDSHPTGAAVVPTTRQVAERVDAGTFVDSNPPVYFIVIEGQFTPDVSVPAGAKEPTGTILTTTINSRTNQGMDGGLEDQMPDLYAMGQPEPLPLPARVDG